MDNKLTKIRRTFAEQLTGKHKLKLLIPSDDSSDCIYELFIEQMFRLLQQKLIEQDERLFKETNRNSPLFIQRKQLEKDINDLKTLNERQDVRAIQQIIERVEHMAMFTRKSHLSDLRSNTNKASPLVVIKSLSTSCSYRILCKELVDRLNWPLELFASEYDRCFCQTCYPMTMPNINQTNILNQHPFVIPRNWMKFGLKVDEVQTKIYQIWDQWAISYHGTVPNAALSMIKHRQICLPGDTLLDGRQLNIRRGHIPHEKAFFTSPTIRYAAQNHYATPLEFTSEIDKSIYTAKIVLRCRQMPNTFSIQCETLNNSQRNGIDYCDVIPDEQIEWKTDQRSSVIFDGLCVRLKKISTHQFIGDRNKIFSEN